MDSSRRNFLRVVTGAAAAAALSPVRGADAPAAIPSAPPGDDRGYWVGLLKKVSEPVLANLAANTLHTNMPVEVGTGASNARRPYTHLEAFGRTLAGIAPWLALENSPATESATIQRYGDLARQALDNATAPAVADYLNFKDRGTQPLVDAAFLAQGILRAPKTLWAKLTPAVQQQVITCLQQTRTLKPGENNWLLFSAMIEAFFASVGAEWQEAPIERAIQSHMQWYKGDGAYGDGAEFHWDYYNSYVIQPMLVQVMETMKKVSDKWSSLWPAVLSRAQRYAAVQERLVAPDGTYPPLGRSIAYRCGAFQHLALMAWRGELPEGVTPAQVRGALTAVIHRTLDVPDTFDSQGWLHIGLAGHQPGLAENYISTGSLYLCTTAFLPIGLPADNSFWASPPTPWTQVKVWRGENLPADHALRGSA